MPAETVAKSPEYVLNHCTKLLARDTTDARHSYFGTYDGQPRASVSEAWRFPIIDTHDGPGDDRHEWNDVTFVFAGPADQDGPASVGVLTTCHALHEPLPLERVGDSRYRARALKVHGGRRHRYRFVVDGQAMLDPLNPQVAVQPSGEAWSTFFTWAYNQPVTFEPWEYALLDRLVRHILPFNAPEVKNFLQRGAFADGVLARNLFRLDASLGVANYVDKVVAREERHQLYAYRTCLEMIDRVLRKRTGGSDPQFVQEEHYERVYEEMANNPGALFADGWDASRYGSPPYFLWLLRRHAWTGAFAHPKYGGNPGGLAWTFLSERYRTTDPAAPATAFDWRQAVEPPLGTSSEYRG